MDDISKFYSSLTVVFSMVISIIFILNLGSVYMPLFDESHLINPLPLSAQRLANASWSSIFCPIGTDIFSFPIIGGDDQPKNLTANDKTLNIEQFDNIFEKNNKVISYPANDNTPSLNTDHALITLSAEKNVDEPDKSSLTTAQSKLSSDLLQLTDNRFLPPGQDRNNLIDSMLHLHQYVPANTYSKNGYMNDEMVYVYIYLMPDASTHVIDPYAWEVTNRDEQNHLAVAWVELKNLNALASLDSVKSIQAVMPPMTN